MPAPHVFEADDLILGKDSLLGSFPRPLLAVLGDPVAHSKSPVFHNAALRATGLDAQYVKIHVRPEELPATLRALPAAGFLGANITIPHKAGALAVVDEADDYARKAGAVNTVVVEAGRLAGFNTDGPGLLRAIREEFSADLRDLRVLLLGAGGGAGRAIAVQCAMENCRRLVLVNRTADRAARLAAELAPFFQRGPAGRILAIPHEDQFLREQLAQTDLVINATSVGMKPADAPLIPASLLTSSLLVFDTVYANGKSRLVTDAEAAGARAANGLSMLLHQGALSFEIWFNRPAPLEIMRAALQSVT